MSGVRTTAVLLRHRVGGRGAARRDARAPLRLTAGATGRTARTAFVDELQRVADGLAERALAAVLEDNSRLVTEIGVRACEVVYLHDVRGERGTVHHRRLVRSLQVWHRTVMVAVARTDAVVDGLDAVLSRYWSRLSARHPDLRDRDDIRPAAIVRSECWGRLHALAPPPPTPGTFPPTVLRRALEIVAVVSTPADDTPIVTTPFPRSPR